MKRITEDRVQQLLAEARKKLADSAPASPAVAAIDRIAAERATGVDIDLASAGIDIQHSEVVEQIAELVSAFADKPRPEAETPKHPHKILGVARDDIILNPKQQSFADRGAKGEDIVLIGAAGTGKTTCQRWLGKKLITDGRIKLLSQSTKWLQAGKHGIAICSFTNKAVNNIRHALPDAIKSHALTIHKLLEFAPVWYEVENPEKPGEMKKTMRFEPQRSKYNPLPSGLALIIFEESSMVSVELHDMLLDACPHKPQLIYLGDIQQLPPVFGSAILGFKMLELPVIELTEVYRQALNSPIISLAWKILAGDPKTFNSKSKSVKLLHPILKKEVDRKIIPALDALSLENEDGKVIFQPWQKQLSADHGLITLTKQFCEWSDSGYYNFNDDIILCPFNVSFGTVEINKGISQHLGRKRKATIHEVVAGYNKHYLAEGDRVLYEKEDATIIKISRNGEYMGKAAQSPSEYLDRWGHLRTEDMDADATTKMEQETDEGKEFDVEAIDKYLELAASEAEDRVTAASHMIDLIIAATGEEVTIDTAAEVNKLLGGYCITIHKAQGSEWDKVFLVLHNSHATMNQRELLYTAVTRAKKYLHIICEPNTFERGVTSQKIKGNTLAEKAEWFKGKLEERERLLLEKRKMQPADDPIKIAFNLVPEWDTLARDSVAHWWKVATKWYPQIATMPVPTFGWKIKGSAAGTANYATNEITCSPVYLHLDPNDMIADTIPHEVAHHVAFRIYKERGHGGRWIEVMKHFGRNPIASKYHDLGKLPAALRKVLEDSKQNLVKQEDEEEKD